MFDLTLSFDNGPEPDVTPACSTAWPAAGCAPPFS